MSDRNRGNSCYNMKSVSDKSRVAEMRGYRKEDYRWLVAAACCCICFYTLGLACNMFSLFQNGIEEQLGISRTQSSAILSLIMAFASVGSFIGARVYSRYGIRNWAAAFGIIVGAGYAVMIHCQNPVLLYGVATLTGIAYGAGSMTASYTIVNNWFMKRNGFVIGIASMGSGIATFACPLIIHWMIGQFGIVWGMMIHGCVIAGFALLTRIVIRDEPEEKGLRPYGIDEWEPGEKTGPGYEAVKRSWRYYVVLILGGAVNACIMPLLGQMASIIKEAGHSGVLAATSVSVLGVTMMLCKPAFGAISDRFGLRVSFVLILVFQGLTLLCCFQLQRGPYMAILLALSAGYMVAVTSVGPGVWIRKLFGSKDYEKTFGNALVVLFLSISGFMLLAGALRNWTGSYTIVFKMDIVLSLLIAVCGILVFREKEQY